MNTTWSALRAAAVLGGALALLAGFGAKQRDNYAVMVNVDTFCWRTYFASWTSGQKPASPIVQQRNRCNCPDGDTLHVLVGRKGSATPARYFIQGYNEAATALTSGNIMSADPDAASNVPPHHLNFAVQFLDLGITFLHLPAVVFKLKDFRTGQGHTGFTNNWWFGGPTCTYWQIGKDLNRYDCVTTDGAHLRFGLMTIPILWPWGIPWKVAIRFVRVGSTPKSQRTAHIHGAEMHPNVLKLGNVADMLSNGFRYTKSVTSCQPFNGVEFMGGDRHLNSEFHVFAGRKSSEPPFSFLLHGLPDGTKNSTNCLVASIYGSLDNAYDEANFAVGLSTMRIAVGIRAEQHVLPDVRLAQVSNIGNTWVICGSTCSLATAAIGDLVLRCRSDAGSVQFASNGAEGFDVTSQSVTRV